MIKRLASVFLLAVLPAGAFGAGSLDLPAYVPLFIPNDQNFSMGHVVMDSGPVPDSASQEGKGVLPWNPVAPAMKPVGPLSLSYDSLIKADSGGAGPFDGLSVLESVIDCDSLDLPSLQADLVHVIIPVGKTVQPFATIAHDASENLREPQDEDRLGFGGGTRWVFSPSADFGTEFFVFSRDRDETDTSSGLLGGLGDLQILTRFEIRF